MKDQYAGDISDLLKYHFIRTVAGRRRIGMAWFYVPSHDRRPDGKHVEWQADQLFTRFDPEIATQLATLRERSVKAVELLPFWPLGTVFHRDAVPSMIRRSVWARDMKKAVQQADFLFCDPDNGIGLKNKHVLIEELRELRYPGRVLSFITFPHRIPHDQQLKSLHERLHIETGAKSVITVRTSISVQGNKGRVPRARWFTVLDGDAEAVAACHLFAERLKENLNARAVVEHTDG